MSVSHVAVVLPRIINDRPTITLLRSVIFNDMTGLAATILELSFETDKDSVAQSSKPVYGEHQ